MTTLKERIKILDVEGVYPVHRSIRFDFVLDITSAHSFETRKKYRACLHVENEFMCKDSDRVAAFENAERFLLRNLHESSLHYIAGIRQAIYNGDEHMALLGLDKLEKNLGL